MAKKLTAKEIRQQKMNRLAELFGAKTGKKIGTACRGKYAGSKDYSVKFDNGGEFYISTGISMFDEKLDRYISQYENFYDNKDFYMEKLKELATADNNLADECGYNHYKVIDIRINTDINTEYYGWIYAVIEVDGTIINFLTSHLNAGLLNGKEEFLNYVNSKRKFFVAGGINENDVDFIFHGVGHSTKSTIYKLR